MVTKEEMISLNFTNSTENAIFQVSSKEMSVFKENKKTLSYMISKKKLEFEKERGIKPTPAYGVLEEVTGISETSIKKTISGKQNCTRNFIYKWAVGLKMSLEEANEYLELCGGKASKSNIGDYIFIRALEDGDSITDFVDQLAEYGVDTSRPKK